MRPFSAIAKPKGKASRAAFSIPGSSEPSSFGCSFAIPSIKSTFESFPCLPLLRYTQRQHRPQMGRTVWKYEFGKKVKTAVNSRIRKLDTRIRHPEVFLIWKV